MTKIIQKILNFLFPKKCISCDKKDFYICDDCLKKINYGEQKEPDVFIATDYGDKVIKKAIWLLKYHGIKKMAEPLAQIIADRMNFDKYAEKDWLIIPIPLFKDRLKERGYNQSEAIGHCLAEKINNRDNMSVRVIHNVLYKKTRTKQQANIEDKKTRLENIKNSFGIINKNIIKDKNIILVDDVTTTGATLNEAKNILKKYGARKIIATVIANG